MAAIKTTASKTAISGLAQMPAVSILYGGGVVD